jgi:hypothetical protein
MPGIISGDVRAKATDTKDTRLRAVDVESVPAAGCIFNPPRKPRKRRASQIQAQ